MVAIFLVISVIDGACEILGWVHEISQELTSYLTQDTRLEVANYRLSVAMISLQTLYGRSSFQISSFFNEDSTNHKSEVESRIMMS